MTLFAFIGTEARFIIERYPLMIAARGLTVVGLDERLRRTSSPEFFTCYINELASI
jgi:hypothetical protein